MGRDGLVRDDDVAVRERRAEGVDVVYVVGRPSMRRVAVVRRLNRRVLDLFRDLEPGDHLVFTHGGVIRLLLWIAVIDCSANPAS